VRRAWLNAAWRGFVDALDDGRLAHALLVTGPESVGKSALARAMAQRLLCTGEAGRGGVACGHCRSCELFVAGAHPDYFHVTCEVNPNTDKLRQEIIVEQVRNLIASLDLTTSFSERKVAVVDPAERLNHHAANALLKTLEEPAGEAVLVLVSHRPSRLPATIRSRCQRIVIPPPAANDAVQWLLERDAADESSARAALALAGGSPGLALRAIEEGQLAHHETLCRGLGALLSRTAPVSAVAGALGDIDPAALWAWLSRLVGEALAGALRARPSPEWLGDPRMLDTRALARLQSHADRNRQLVETTVRQDLLLHEWLLEWARRVPRTEAD
jgi:DNA polymerase-3 subunit delta'